MNYKFPEIRTIDDVLPHIEGREEFIVAKRDFGSVVNYVVAMQDTFDMTGPDDLGGVIRRECRGLKFYPDGKIAARTFFKFFNIGEREETQPHLIDMSKPHNIEEKRDGSMLHPMMVNGYIRWMTKMGITEVSMQAEEYIAKHSKYKDFAKWCIENGLTPIFEWTSPNNQIVVPYEEDELTLLSVRENVSGKFLNIRSDSMLLKKIRDLDIPVVDVIEPFRDVQSLMQYTKTLKNAEGFIVAFEDGHKVKIKAEEYVRIHKTMDRIRFDRNIVDLIINENVDDVVGMLPEAEAEKVHQFEERFWNSFKVKEDYLLALRDIARQLYDDDRKRIALEFIPTLERKEDAGFVFKMLDGHDLRMLMLAHIEKCISSNTKWDACAEWMGMK